MDGDGEAGDSGGRKRSRSSIGANLGVLALVGLSLASLWFVVLRQGLSERETHMAEAGDSVRRMAQVAMEQTLGVFSEVKVYLSLLELWLEDNPGADPRFDPDFLRLVENLRDQTRLRIDLRLVSRDGGLYYIPSTPGAPALADVSDRAYFTALSDPSARGIYIGEAIKSRVTGLWGIPISSRIESGNGGMAVIFAAMELQYLNAMYDSIRTVPDGAVSLVRDDGLLLTRVPFSESHLGRDLSGIPDWAGRGEEPRRSISVFDGTDRLVSIKDVPGFPLMIVVAESVEGIMERWRKAMAFRVALLSAVTLALLYLSASLARDWRLMNRSARNIERLNAELNRSIEQVRGQLGEKELLIRETNHRVKNHMAQLMALLNFSRGGDPETIFADLEARILGYRVLYERLSYRADGGENLDLAGYIHELTDELLAVTPGGDAVRATYEGGTAMLPARKCTTIGLILNELVTNAVKHGRGADGTVSLRVSTRAEGDRVTLEVADGGPGFDFEAARLRQGERHIGMMLIDTLLKQYDGRIEYERRDGSRFTVTL